MRHTQAGRSDEKAELEGLGLPVEMAASGNVMVGLIMAVDPPLAPPPQSLLVASHFLLSIWGISYHLQIKS